LRQIIAGLALAALWCGSASAQVAAATTPTAAKCAAVYGAFAQDQANFGSTDSLLGERYFNFSRINFEDRLNRLAGKAEKGVTELKSATESERSALYMKLVDAETEGEMDNQAIRDMIRQSDACDAEFGFAPSLGG
jgi:hypothetical protein